MEIGRRKNSEQGATAYVGEGQVDSVRAGIHGNRVRPRRPVPPELGERFLSFLEHRHDAGLGGYVQPPERRVERQDVRIAPDWKHLAQLKGP